MISNDTIDKVRELSIVDVVSKYLTLKKAGAQYRCISPFNKNEKSPSFYVHPAKNIFKCFSSGHGGDGIAFVMQKDGCNFQEAINTIAKDFGLEIKFEENGQHPPEHYEEIELLYKINQAAAKRYATQLLDIDATHPAFIELIDRRKFEPDTLLQWQIGFAPGSVGENYTPKEWRFLTETLVQKGFHSQGEELGLIKTKNEVNYDALRNRLTFPIIDQHGRYVGFGARAMQPDEFNPKYMNSPDSRIYNKSQTLYGLNFATKAIREKGFATLMEGYTDVISFHQAGFNTAVGTCGTSLTDDQAKLLYKYTKRVVLIYDGDPAGKNACLRSIEILMKHGFQTSVVPMPEVEVEGKKVKVDPDELVRMF